MPKSNKLLIVGLLIIFISLCLVSCVSAASTVYINTTGNDTTGNGSIENPYQTIGKGISSVDDNGTVNIANGNYSGVGNVNLTISKNMTISGESQKGTIINGNGTNWIFHISPGVNVSIQNLTITANSGRAVNNQGNLTVTNCNFTDNTANGAISNYGNCTVASSTFTDNTAPYYGGAIYNQGTLNVVSSTFSGNSAQYGGAIYNSGNCTVASSTFTGNSATSTGGAIYNQGTLNVIGSTFTSNLALWAGAIYNSGNCTVIGSTFTSNNATSTGGAIYNSGNCTVTSSTLTDDTASGGGAIYNQGTLTANFNRFFNNTATRGNAIYNNGGTLDATLNWWGSNLNPVNVLNLFYVASGSINATSWVILTVNATINSITPAQTPTIIADLNHINGGDLLAGGQIPDGIPVTFSSTLGFVNPVSVVTIGGQATTVFTTSCFFGIASVNAITDNENVSTNITVGININTGSGNTGNGTSTVNPSANLYINTTTSNQNPPTGGIFTLTYKLGNKGPDEAKNVTITFQLPESLEFANISVDNGICTYDPTTRTVTWTLVSVPVGDPYLYLTVKAAGDGTYKITPSITSDTYNLNSRDSGIITINVKSNNNENTVNAASKTTKTIGLQETGLPINYLLLAVLMVLSGLVPKRK